jgi:hypothetical protein
MMTTKEAWTAIAEAYAKFKRRPRLDAPRTLTSAGFCAAIGHLMQRGDISYQHFMEMQQQINDALEDRRAEDGLGWFVLWPFDAEGAAHRTILATLFAEAAE